MIGEMSSSAARERRICARDTYRDATTPNRKPRLGNLGMTALSGDGYCRGLGRYESGCPRLRI